MQYQSNKVLKVHEKKNSSNIERRNRQEGRGNGKDGKGNKRLLKSKTTTPPQKKKHLIYKPNSIPKFAAAFRRNLFLVGHTLPD